MRLSLPCSIGRLAEPEFMLLGEALRFAERLDAAVLVAEGDNGGLEVAFEAWSRLGRYPESLTDPDERDEVLEILEALEQTLSRTPALSLRLMGLLSRDKSSIRVAAGDDAVDLGADWPMSGGRPVMVGPLAAAALAEARAYNLATTDDERRTAILAMNRFARSHQRAMDGRGILKVATSLKLDGTSRAQKLHLRVEDALNERDRVSVRAEVVDEDGRRVEINSKSHRPKSGVVEAPGRHLIELSDSHRRALADIGGLKAVTREELAQRGALEAPQRLLSSAALEHAGDTIEFHGYSERVIRFREAQPGELQRTGAATGLDWVDAADSDGSPLYYLLRQRDEEGRAVEIQVSSREAAEQLFGMCQAAIEAEQRGEPIPRVTAQGVPIRDVRAVAGDLQGRLSADSETAKPDLDASGRGRPMVAELRDAEATDAGDAATVEPAWELLHQALEPSFQILEHQREGIRWLWSRYIAGTKDGAKGKLGALLADDMGLGKTFQIAACMLLASRSATADLARRPHLVVAPKILLHNWLREIEAYFRPRMLTARVVEGRELRTGSGSLVDSLGHIRPRVLQEHDVWITNYDTVQSYGEALGTVDWHVVVLDEAQAIKNAATAASKNACALKKAFGVASTGTPVENALTDVFPLGDFSFPGVLAANVRDFSEQYPAKSPTSVAKLRQRLNLGLGTRALVLRREKARVLADRLPRKSVAVVPIEMSAEQRDTERSLVQVARGAKAGRLELLSSLQKLYQHPQLLESAADAPLPQLRLLLDESPKLRWLLSKLHEIRDRHEKVLIFTVFRRMQKIVAHLLRAEFPDVVAGRDVVINGEAGSIKTALERIRSFSGRPGFDVLVLSPRAAGTGLNITAANHVVHYGRWWNPAREDQATDRAYRIGQTRPVHVWVPVLHHPGDPSGGFDVRLDQLMRSKRELAADFLMPTDGDVTDAELRQVFGGDTEVIS